MRYLKTYKIFEAKTSGLTPEQEKWLDKCTDGTWSYNPKTGLVDVAWNFNCDGQELSDFKEVRFGVVGGYFSCTNNRLTTLEGAPQEVGESFSCTNNRLTTLEGAPQKLGWNFSCRNNRLTTLEGAPQVVRGSFYCEENELTTLEGAPEEVGGHFYCRKNRLTTLEGAPQVVRGNFYCEENKLTTLEGAPQKLGSDFLCDDFELRNFEYGKGLWNFPEGWIKILAEGSSKAQNLILTLLTPEVLNKEIQKDPTGMVLALKSVWNEESFRMIRSKLIWPRGYEKEADLLGDLDDVGF